MKKVLLGLSLVLVLVSASFAEEVVVTAKGNKFHVATCYLIKNRETTTMDKAAAEAKGLKACSRCSGSAAADTSSVEDMSKKVSKKK